MGNIVAGVAANVLVGPARMLVAPIGTTVPTLDGTVDPITWDAAWLEVGFTEDGTTLAYAPTVKDHMVDESLSPVQKTLDTEKATVSCKCAEATLQNLNYAIATSKYAHSVKDATHAEVTSLKVGSGSLTEVMVGFEGKSPKGKQRIFIGYRALAQANVSMSFKRGDKTLVPLELGLMADTSKPIGEQLFEMVDIGDAKSAA